LSAADIRAMSTATYLYSQDGDSFEQVPPSPCKDRNKDRACVSIQAYWHNDRPGGIILKATASRGKNLDAEMDALDVLVMKMAELQLSASDCDEYLRHMAQQPERDNDTNFQVIATIAYAEEAGYLSSDEYNGMLYIYRQGDDEFYIDRKDR
jgi:hypothetical protein